MDLVPMNFSIEKYVELDVDVMVHKDMLTETGGWNHQKVDIPDEVRDHFIDGDDEWHAGNTEYSETVNVCKCYGGYVNYILTKDGLVPLESLPDLKDEDLSWGEDTSAHATQETSSTSEAQI